MERAWYDLGKPYFKVWPAMAAQLANVRMDIDMEFLHLPFKVYEIRLPVNDNVLREEAGPPLKALLVQRVDNAEVSELTSARDWTLVVHYQFATELDKPWMGWYFGLPVRKGILVEEQITQTSEQNEAYTEGYTPSLEFLRNIVRLAISVAFFGVGHHELVAPDIPRCYIDKYRQAKQAQNTRVAEDILTSAKALGMFGFKVGSEVDLPAPVVRYIDASGEKRGELTHGHIRRAHMHFVCCGEGRKERKLQFFPPIPVRPDLPLAPAHGFRIRG